MKKTEKTYHDNGNIHFESELNEKRERHGITRIYHENGQLKAELNWTNGIQDDGIINSYHDNGIKARQVIHLNGDFNGEFSEWHENGQLKRKSFYEANMIHGIYKTWDSFGNLKNNFFKHKFIDTIDCEKFVSYNREQKNIEEIEVNWLQDIGPIYKKFIDKNEVTSTLQHTLDDENEYISVFSHNEEDAKNIIDTVIENNGGFSVFESFESENWHYNNSGCLFNIGYKIIIPDKLYVVQLNRDTKNDELENISDEPRANSNTKKSTYDNEPIVAEWTNSEKEEYLNNSRKVNTKLLYNLREEYFKLHDNNNYSEAIKKLTQIIEQIPVLKGQSLIAYTDPSDILNGILLEEIYFNRSQLYYGLNLFDDAKNDLIKAINSNPGRKEPIIHHHLGCTMIQCGDFTSCIEHFNIAIEKDPEYYDSYYMRAAAYSSDKSELTDINKAIDDLKKYLEHDPGDNAANNLLNTLQ